MTIRWKYSQNLTRLFVEIVYLCGKFMAEKKTTDYEIQIEQ